MDWIGFFFGSHELFFNFSLNEISGIKNLFFHFSFQSPGETTKIRETLFRSFCFNRKKKRNSPKRLEKFVIETVQKLIWQESVNKWEAILGQPELGLGTKKFNNPHSKSFLIRRQLVIRMKSKVTIDSLAVKVCQRDNCQIYFFLDGLYPNNNSNKIKLHEDVQNSDSSRKLVVYIQCDDILNSKILCLSKIKIITIFSLSSAQKF